MNPLWEGGLAKEVLIQLYAHFTVHIALCGAVLLCRIMLNGLWNILFECQIPKGGVYCRAVMVGMVTIPVLDPFLSSEATRAGFWQPDVRSEPLVPLLSALSSTAPCSTRQ